MEREEPSPRDRCPATEPANEPASESAGLLSSLEPQEKAQEQRDVDRLFEFLEKQYEDPGLAAYVEWKLHKAGLLSRLEKVGVLPIVENPNPYDPELEEEQHEKWWEEHLEEGEEFRRNFEKREEILRYLYVGALLGS